MRPTKFSPEAVASILDDVSRGVCLAVAAEYAGVARQTVNAWLRRGKRTGVSDQPYREFRSAYGKAQASGRRAFELSACAMAAQDGKVALAILAKRWPEDWGDHMAELRDLRKRVEAMEAKTQAAGVTPAPA